MEQTLNTESGFDQLRFSLNRSIRYHDCRADFLRKGSRFCSLLTAILGTGAAAAVVKEGPRWVQLSLPVSVAAVSLFNLIFDLRGTADVHRKLSSKFSELL